MDLTPYLVAHYKMNDNAASAIVLDSSGNGYNGTFHGTDANTSAHDTNGVVGGGLTFNGTTDYINIGSVASWANNSFTISIWVKPDDGQPDNIQSLYGLSESDGSLRLYIRTDGSIFCPYTAKKGDTEEVLIGSDVIFQNGQETWHHIVRTITKLDTTNAIGNLYLDRVLIGTSGIVENANMSHWDDPTPVFIGARCSDNQTFDPVEFFSGSLDNVMIFNKALSQEEITYLYNFGYGTEDLSSGSSVLSIPDIMTLLE